MYLKSLELHGFKSFPEKTVLQFHDGATVIVGPNGSGKSNITDAMRWVLGELSTKNIRGSKMEDVVFAGADGKKPMSFAEVSVTFDDSTEPKVLASGYDEVTVTRRYYRSGDSEYFINRKRARLKDIYELFMNTGIGREGYSIIGQGKIAEIISKKSEERRSAFEESAGISKYRYRKTESEKKLAETTANMERVADIEGELAARIVPLERDAAKARKYLELYDAKKRTDTALWLYDADVYSENIKKASQDTRMSAHELEMADDSRKQTEDRIDRLYEQSHANKEASQHTHEQYSAAAGEKAALEGEVQVAQTEKKHKYDQIAAEEAAIAAAESEIRSAADREKELLQRKTETDNRYDEEEAEAEKAQETTDRYTAARKEAADQLETLLVSQKEKETNLTELRVRIHMLQENASSHSRRQQTIAEELEKYRSEEAGYDRIIRSCSQTIQEYQANLDALQTSMADSDRETEAIRQKLSAIQNHLTGLAGQREGLVSRMNALQRMQEHFDGYNNSTRFVMSQAGEGRLQGIHGPVSHLIRVQQAYVIAIETALGSALQNIITEDENAAKAAIAALKQANAGRATFYPITTIRPQERGREFDGVETGTGFIGYADTLVECDEQYRNIIRSQLARTAVFDTLDHATEMARRKNWRIRTVTLDGQIINAGGSFTGGQAKKESGILTRSSQVDRMAEELKILDKTIADTKAALEKEQKKADEAASRSRDGEEKRSILTTLLQAEESQRKETTAKKEYVAGLLAKLLQDSASLEESGRRSAADMAEMTAQTETLQTEIEAIAARREEIAVERNETEDELNRWQQTWQECRIRLAELARDRENLADLLTDCRNRMQTVQETVQACEAHILVLQAEIAEIEKQIAEKTEAGTRLTEAIDVLSAKQQTLQETGDALDKELAELQVRLKEQNNKKELVYIAHTKNETRLQTLQSEYDKMTQKLWDEYELTYATAKAYLEEAEVPPVGQGERTSYLTRQNALKAEIRSLGHVNVDAIEEYAEVKQRYDYIKAQMDDLTKAKEELERILDGIEKDMRDIFVSAFQKINTYFGQVFRELFGGGHAEVVLTDPENPLTCGIDINAAPPGKTIKNLNLLSGGEQAFIAIALLFALIKVNPSPFCIFDEIEAALDETNVARVGRYVKKYTSEMQIIMISHRRGTMEIADTLYGVTMPQPGISKVTTVDMKTDRDTIIKTGN
ncbi:MAG: chromosome segregation protein SMC [Ruminococcaceae bacterium]|nr:chromosome segregation protein SMC [Oscillospiraceae bacterium]